MASLSLGQRIATLENNSSTGGGGGGGGGTTTIENVENLQSTLDSKQNELTVGENVTIVNDIISSTDEIQPRFMAYYAVIGNFVTVNAGNNVLFPTVKYNVGGGTYNTSTSTYTVPSAGLYIFNAHWFFTVNHIVVLLRNDAIVKSAQASATFNGFNIGSFGGVFLECNAGDTILVRVTSGSIVLSHTQAEVSTQGWHQFTGYRISI